MVILKIGSACDNVKIWQQYLVTQGYALTTDGNFGPQTEDATKLFQQKHGLVVDGEVGPITFNYASSISHPAPNIIHSNQDVLLWIKNNLKVILTIATTGTEFTEDWLAAIAARETGGLITKYVNRGNTTINDLASLMKGDFTNGIYHGFSFWQIDIRSFPDFIHSDDWKNPQKSAIKAIAVLQGKKKSLIALGITRYSLSQDIIDRAITASFNCGEGNVMKAIKSNKDIDSYTANNDYSKQVFNFRKVYVNL
jgi:hypothetical protein